MSICPRSTKIVVLAFLLLSARVAAAQSCPVPSTRDPQTANDPSVLHGTVIHHDELRTWLGLRLDRPACGQTEIQLWFDSSDALRKADSLRNCRVTATGTLFLSPTGHYSAHMAIEEAELKPDDSCHPFPVEPDPSEAEISPSLQSYYVLITIDTRGKGHTDARVFADPDARQPLSPSGAYTEFGLNGGGDVLWFGCREGFSPEGAVKNPPSATANLRQLGPNLQVDLDVDKINTIKFICRRAPRAQ